ncbi:MAG: DUF669 domain-containing protein [Phycisphaerae bacterium]|jgi:hypothetical protein
MAEFSFDPHRHAPGAALEPLPDGKYAMSIIDSERRTPRSGDGEYIQLALRVMSGTHESRVIFHRLHVVTANATTRRIAEAELASICRAASVDKLRDTTQLHGRPIIVTLGHRRDAGGQTLNVPRSYAPVRQEHSVDVEMTPVVPATRTRR